MPTTWEAPRYPHRPPAHPGGTEEARVAIVGGGLVGLTAALDLARHGIASVLLDDDLAGWRFAGAAGALLTVVWNYAVSSTLVWRRRMWASPRCCWMTIWRGGASPARPGRC